MGNDEVVIVGGRENMSTCHRIPPSSGNGKLTGDRNMIDAANMGGLRYAFDACHRGTMRSSPVSDSR